VDELAAVINRVGRERIDGDGGVPVEADVDVRVGRRRADVFALAGAEVPADQVPLLAHGVAGHGVGRNRHGAEAVAEADFLPVPVADAGGFPGRVRPFPRAVVLHAAVDVVRGLVVDGDVVVLRERQRGHEAPRRAAVLALRHAAVVADEDVRGVRGVDPHRVIVGVDFRERDHGPERLAAVVRDGDQREDVVDAVRILRVDADVGVVERAVGDVVLGVDRRPFAAAVVGAQERALLGFHEGVDDARIRARDGDADASEVAFRHSILLGEPLPGRAAVVRHMQARAGAAGVEEPRPAAVLPHRGEEFVRVGRIDDQIRGADLVVHEEDFRPGPAAVDGFEDAAVGVLAPRLAHRRDPGDVGIARVENDAVNALGLVEAVVLPGLAAVDGFVDAVADGHGVARIAFTRADPDDVGTGLEDRHRADRGRRLVVEDRREREPAVDRLPHPARRRADVDDVGIRLDDVDRRDAAGHRRGPDGAGLHAGQELGIDLGVGEGGGEGEEEKEGCQSHLHARGIVRPILAVT
jgi:hypothetical protein